MQQHLSKDDRQSALFCTAVITSLHGNPLDGEQLRHQFADTNRELQPADLARILNEAGCRATPVSRKLEKIRGEAFPLVARDRNGAYLVLAKRSDKGDAYLVQRQGEERAAWLAAPRLQAELSNDFILLQKRGGRDGAPPRFGLRWFIATSMKYRSILRDCFIASFFVQLFTLASPLIFMLVIDKVLSHNSLSTLDVLVFALIVISIFEVLLNSLRAYLLSHTANRLDLMLGLQLFRHLLTLPLSYFETRQVGDTVARMRELETIRGFITGSGIMLFLDLLFLLVFLGVMFLFSPFLTLLVMLTIPFLFLGSFVLTPFLRDRLEDKYNSNATSQSFLVEAIAGMETIKSSASEPRIREKWEQQLGQHVKTGFASGNLANLINQTTTIVSRTLTVILLWFGAREVLAGNLTVGQLIAFNMLSSRVIAPIIRLSQIAKELQQTNVAVARIGDILNTHGEPGFDPQRVSLPPIRGQVRFDRVGFRYQADGREVLTDISFAVQPGEVIGIVGSTGSGKTTLIKLLQRLYVAERGRVLIDGVDLALADASWLRRQIGVVTQDGVLFNSSIRDNITLNCPGLEIGAVMEAARLAGAHDFIMELAKGYDTVVGERGILLSTGQRQRLAIARALATNPRMLILDEATSALDYESELLIQKNMRKICRDRTAFIVAHRLPTVRHADRILTLEQGRLIEDGRPAELLAAGGRFASLHRIQEGSHA